MFRVSAFEKCLDKATSHLLMEADWPSILQICDLIRQNDVQPKIAFTAIRKKLQSDNPHTAMYALMVLESMVKNCGTIVHEELTSKANCDFFYELVRTTPHNNVREKLLELIQAWNFALRKNAKHAYLKELLNTLKAENFKLPAMRESDAMFAADSAPEWADGDSCHRCRVQFTLINRKHHCRNCGQVFCGNCSQKTISLPKFGIEKEVRVCDTCYLIVTKPTSQREKDELPAEYLKSSLAQQKQEPPRKSEDELKEEEDLQLALALSQSEAEAKEKEKMKVTSTLHNAYNTTKVSESKVVERNPSPADEPSNPELERYMNRSYWESLNLNDESQSPTAPAQNVEVKLKENGISDNDLEEFIKTLKSQVEIFINRMKSNSSRGRSIANDTSVQTLFMNITAMHSRLLRYIQQHDDNRLHYERLQDKLTQMKDARAALDALRDEHREKLRRAAEEAERQRQMQMAHKLEIMRKKKQEYLQYQRQLALQRIQEQEREMHMRQEQQKQQYLMGSQYGGYIGSPVHGQQYQQGPPAPNPNAPMNYNYQFPPPTMPMPNMPPQQPPHPMHNPGQMPGHPMTGPPAFPTQQFVSQHPMPGAPNMQQNGPPQPIPMQPMAQTSAPNPPNQNVQQFSPPGEIKKEEAQTGELISFD